MRITKNTSYFKPISIVYMDQKIKGPLREKQPFNLPKNHQGTL